MHDLVALIASFLISSISKGLVKYSNAPPLYADNALSIFACAVIIMVGILGNFLIPYLKTLDLTYRAF